MLYTNTHATKSAQSVSEHSPVKPRFLTNQSVRYLTAVIGRYIHMYLSVNMCGLLFNTTFEDYAGLVFLNPGYTENYYVCGCDVSGVATSAALPSPVTTPGLSTARPV